MGAVIRAIEYYLPEETLTNAQLAAEFPEWTAEKIEQKLGIVERRLAAPGETASSMAIEAARKVFACGNISPLSVNFVLLCTQSPDYFLPTTACIVQDELGIPTTAGALDINLGCSGYVYGLGLAKGLIETGQASRVLLLTSEMYSRYIHPQDKSVRTLFGDAAAATVVEASEGKDDIGPFVYGTDGRGRDNLIVPAGGRKLPAVPDAEAEVDEQGNRRTVNNLRMNGAEIFNFTLLTVPKSVRKTLEKAGKTAGDIDLFVFHQANRYMLEHLRKKIGIPEEKFLVGMSHCGNTVSSSIPIALKDAASAGRLRPGHQVMVVGFGVGYSWASAIIRWNGSEADRLS